MLLHREDFKIPEKMARFAVRHGMAGFVKKMGAGVHPFVEARRARVAKVCCLGRMRCTESDARMVTVVAGHKGHWGL